MKTATIVNIPPLHVEDERTGLSKAALKRAFLDNLFYIQGKFPALATMKDYYMALAYTVRDRLLQRWVSTAETYTRHGSRTVAYLSAEFLLVDSLLYHDPFLVLADFQAYVDCQARVSQTYQDKEKWTRMSILNVARSGKFSSDRTIREYCEDIWKAPPVKIDLLSQEEVSGNLVQ